MSSHLAFDNIQKDDFEDILSQYPEVIPEKLFDLEAQRLSIIPTVLTERRKDGAAFLSKDDVATLVDWKLSHGTFRPSLKGLVQQNSPEFVQETTTAGFAAESLNDKLNTLTKLKGIGPATAALLLSTSNPDELPFFSDEVFRWAFWEDKAGGRWDRKIKYSLKEYRELVARVDELRERLGKGALEAEKVAYVLGKRGEQLGGDGGAGDAKDAKPQPKRKAGESASTRDNADSPPRDKKQKMSAPSTSGRVTRSTNKSKSQG